MTRSTKEANRLLKLEYARDVEVLEKNSDTAWALFQRLLEQQQQRSPEEATVEDVLAETRKNNRVCPMPSVWKRLYDALPNKTAELPTVPCTSQEWKETPALQKRTRLRHHIEWAARQGMLAHVYEQLGQLPENKWHHMGE